MKYAKLGNSDLKVSRVCMGCMGFGDPGRGQHSWTVDEEHTREIILIIGWQNQSRIRLISLPNDKFGSE